MTGRQPRADARRNLDAVLQAAKTVFGTSGVDAPAKEIADLAGVGVGTVYRHFPQRSDLIVAVLHREMDAVADSAKAFSDAYEPWDALTKWFGRYIDFLATKPGFAKALHSGDPAFEALPGHFHARVGPALQSLLDAAGADATAGDLLTAVALLCRPARGGGIDYGRRMVAILLAGLR